MAKSNTLGTDPFKLVGPSVIVRLCAACDSDNALFSILDAGVAGGLLTTEQADAIGFKFDIEWEPGPRHPDAQTLWDDAWTRLVNQRPTKRVTP